MDDAAINGVSDSSIYTGIWTNWSHGYIRYVSLSSKYQQLSSASQSCFLRFYLTDTSAFLSLVAKWNLNSSSILESTRD